jgi:beta-aspartyl-dipeptidase (metallo-type)
MVRATLIYDGDLYTPQPLGRGSVLAVDGMIAATGTIARREVEDALGVLGIELQVVDARGCIVVPGLIDPHEHLLGSSGEEGFSSRSPEIFCTELIASGITTVVGTLGTDTSMRTMAELLAKVKALEEEGLSAYMYSGGYTLPPVTVMGSLRNDLLFIDRVIGAGEIAVSDRRAVQPMIHELAAAITEAYVGGLLSRKAGVTHIHVGAGAARLAPVRAVLDDFDVDPAAIYPTHVARTRELLSEAAALTHRGAFVDIDTTDRELPSALDSYVQDHGDLERLTVSTDAGSTSPGTLIQELAECVRDGWSLESILPLATTNTARVLKLPAKGRLERGCDADVLALSGGTLEPVHLVARGAVLMEHGNVKARPTFLKQTNRLVTLSGEKD